MSAPASRLRRTCDIVMKGGITSGVVYPQAITTLAERYDFKNIGGTSPSKAHSRKELAFT